MITSRDKRVNNSVESQRGMTFFKVKIDIRITIMSVISLCMSNDLRV